MEANREENAKEVLHLGSSKIRIVSIELILSHVWRKGRGNIVASYCVRFTVTGYNHG